METITPTDTQRRSLFREVNERIRGITESFAVADESYDVFCECGRRGCVERLAVPTAVYDRIRGDARIYLVRSGHEALLGGHVLDAADAYSVVLAT
jgi:predicted NBD/HSP70 family sugar kinase